MGASLSTGVAVACVAAYAGVLDLSTLTSDSSMAIAKMALLGAVALASSFGAVVLILASKYKTMIKENAFDIDSARRRRECDGASLQKQARARVCWWLCSD